MKIVMMKNIEKSQIKEYLYSVIEEKKGLLRFAYPRDNSYSFIINENDSEEEICPFLAGVKGELAKRVAVVSEPFTMKIESWGSTDSLEFVIVLYEDEFSVVLNNLVDEQPYDYDSDYND